MNEEIAARDQVNRDVNADNSIEPSADSAAQIRPGSSVKMNTIPAMTVSSAMATAATACTNTSTRSPGSAASPDTIVPGSQVENPTTA
ncbi:hypothetical protein [Streptomyces sp. NPDC001759]